MSSEIRVNKINNRAGLGTVEYTPTGIIVSGIVTAYEFDGNFDTTPGIVVTGIATAAAIDLNGDLDVDGHTNLDNLSIAGVTTMSGVVNMSSNVNMGGGNLTFSDSGGDSDDKLVFGQGADFKIFHNGSNNYIDVAGDGHLYIRPKANFYIQDYTNGEVWIDGTLNGGVKLYNNGIKKFETDGNGITVQGNINMATDSTLHLGAGNDFRLFHNGTTNYIRSTNGNIQIDNSSGVPCAQFVPGQGTKLYYGAAVKFTTETSGVNITGVCTATSFSGDGSNLTGITGTTINNNSDNRLITGSGTANTLNAEATLHYSDSLSITGSATPLSGTGHNYSVNLYRDSGSGYGYLDVVTGSSNHTGVRIRAYHNGTYNNVFEHNTNDYTSFSTGGSERLRITSAGQLVMGATTSKAKFEIKDNGYSSSTVLQRISGDDANPYALIIANDTCNTAAASGLQLFVSDSGEHYVRARASSTAGNNNLRLSAQNNVLLYSGSSETERLRITSSGRFGLNRSSPHYAMHLSPADGETRIDLHMTNDTTGHNAGDGVQFGYQNGAGAYIWNYENTPIYFGQNNIKKFEIHATGSTQIYKGDLLLGPDNVSQMEATIRAWGCSLWYTTIDTDYYHDSGGEFRVFYNKGSFRGDNYLTAYNCPIQSGVGPQNRVFWRGAANDTRAEGTVDISVGYRGAFFFISRTCPNAIRAGSSGKYLYDSNSPNRVSVSFDSFGNNIDTQELSFHAGSSAGYNSGDATVGGRLGSSNTDSTLRMYAVGVNMENYNAPNSKKAGNHLGISVINEDGTDYGSSRLSENLINNSTTGGTNGGGGSTEFNWGTRHSNDRGYNSNMQFSQILYFDDVQLNSSQWDYLEHYFKVMYG